MDPITLTNGHSNSHDEPSTSTASAVSFDPEIFRTYLLALLPPVIGASPSDLESLFDDEFEARVTRFASEAGAVLYVVQTKEEIEGTTPGRLETCLMFTGRRGCTTSILVSPHISTRIPSLKCHDSGPHQTRCNTGPFDPSDNTTALLEPLRRRRDAIRKSTRSGEPWCQAVVRCLCWVKRGRKGG